MYLQVNGFALLTLCVLLLSTWGENSVSDNRLFSGLIWMVIAILLVDSTVWSLDGHSAVVIRPLLSCLHTLYFVLTQVIAAVWFAYVYELIHGEGALFRNRKRAAVFLLPLAVFFVLLCLSPILDTVFLLDTQNRYHRGRLFFLQYIIGFGYMLSASVFALLQRAHEESTERKREFSTLALFALFPLVGGILQICFYGTVLLWPATTASILMISSHLHRAQVATDALTQLNNRRRFDRYFTTCVRNTHASHPWYLILLDVDDFKQINDRFGHPAGDSALCTVAQLLRQTFGLSDAFIARYGGDEFAVVLYGVDDAQVDALLERLHHACMHVERPEECYSLSLSAGAVRYDGKPALRPTELIDRADRIMYRQKAEKKSAVCKA